MKISDREMVRRRALAGARVILTNAVSEACEQHDLTDVELVSLLAEMSARWAQILVRSEWDELNEDDDEKTGSEEP